MMWRWYELRLGAGRALNGPLFIARYVVALGLLALALDQGLALVLRTGLAPLDAAFAPRADDLPAGQRRPFTPLSDAAAQTIVTGELVPTQSPWRIAPRRAQTFDDRTPPAGAQPPASRAAAPATPIAQTVDSEDESEVGWNFYSGDGGTYRTVCVRLCDGFYWPISFSTTPDNFDRDAKTCKSSCGSPARLYVYKNPGGTPEQMEDARGQPYTALKTAFQFRTRFDAACKCNAQPWEQASRDRHRVYALEAERRKGSKVAAQELALLRSRLTAQIREDDAARKADAVQAARTTAQPAAPRGRTARPRQTIMPGLTPSPYMMSPAVAASMGVPAPLASLSQDDADDPATWRERSFERPHATPPAWASRAPDVESSRYYRSPPPWPQPFGLGRSGGGGGGYVPSPPPARGRDWRSDVFRAR